MTTEPFTAFRLIALDPAPFAPLFELDDAALAARGMRRTVADTPVGYPCRISLADAAVGDELLLLPFEHQPAASPYRSSGPIFVRRGATRAVFAPGEIPLAVATRLMSVRAYDAGHDIVDASVCEGADLAAEFARMFASRTVAYLHLHHARRGCYACAVERAMERRCQAFSLEPPFHEAR